jgi:hypothetical protein
MVARQCTSAGRELSRCARNVGVDVGVTKSEHTSGEEHPQGRDRRVGAP